MTDDTFFAFFIERNDESGRLKGYRFSTDIDAIWGESAEENKTSDDVEQAKADAIPEAEDRNDIALSGVFTQALKMGLSQYHLIAVSGTLRSAMMKAIIDQEIIKPVTENCKCIDEKDGCRVFGVDEALFRELIESSKKLDRMSDGLAALPGAVLMSLVATFDSLITDVVKRMLKSRPERYANSERTIHIKDVIAMRSFDDFMDTVVEEEAYSFSRASHEEQVKFIEKNLHVPIIKHWKRWPDFIEVFERRNLIAHGESLFNSRYVAICKQAGHLGAEKIEGTAIELTSNYLYQAEDILLEFSILLIFVLWRKHFEEYEKEAFEKLNNASFDLIVNGRFKVAIHVIEFALSLKASGISEVCRRMLVVNLASSFRHSGNQNKCVSTLDQEDWSASSEDFRICVAALKDDVDAVLQIMPAVANKLVDKASFRTWPVFKWVREVADFQQKFEEIFGEPLIQARGSSKADASDNRLSDAGVELGGSGGVH